MTENSRFMRHIKACQNTRLPGGRKPFLIDEAIVGWLGARAYPVLAALPEVSPAPDGGLRIERPDALRALERALIGAGLTRWRGEAFDVRAACDGPVLGTLDRGCLPLLGVEATGVHLNGLVETEDGLMVWVARRALDKAIDPGKLDHLVAGGVPAGLTARETLAKEAGEEAGLTAEMAAQAREVGRIAYVMSRPEGLRRDRLICYDLPLPADFTPCPMDGEAEGFELWPIGRVFAAVRDTDDFKFNVSLVLIDLFLRRGLIEGAEAARLRAALDGEASQGQR